MLLVSPTELLYRYNILHGTHAVVLGLCSFVSRTDGDTVQLFGITFQFVPALPGAQRYCYSTVGEVSAAY